jgi:hypothetical protein
LLFVRERVDFLVATPELSPFWVPSNLFDVVDASVPAGWEFCITNMRSGYSVLFNMFGIGYIMGYPLLVNDYKHYVGVVEREPSELQRFIEEAAKL